jgi:hypothetical protein
MTDDPFDLEKLRLTPREAGEKWVKVPLKFQKRRQHFVKVPWTWIQNLVKARCIATYRVALHVLYQHWRGEGEPFILANGSLRMEGVSRRQKWPALRELEQFGLITVEWRQRKSPRITVNVSPSGACGLHR